MGSRATLNIKVAKGRLGASLRLEASKRQLSVEQRRASMHGARNEGQLSPSYLHFRPEAASWEGSRRGPGAELEPSK